MLQELFNQSEDAVRGMIGIEKHVADCGFLRFDENYALAYTQSLKNKDIPENGAKGTILPS
jgi:NAD-specific glutamate dehydrogenase